MSMTDKRFYVTIEVTAQLSAGLSKDTKENRDEIGRRIRQYFYNPKARKLDYDCHINGENMISINDEKGQTL